MGQFAEYALFLSSRHTDTVVERSIQIKVYVVGLLIAISSAGFVSAQTIAQGCVIDVLSTQISQIGMHGGNTTVQPVVENMKDGCVRVNSILMAVSLSLLTLQAAILGVLPSRSRAGSSTGMSAHYEPDTRRLVLLFPRPVVAQNPQRMVSVVAGLGRELFS